MHHIQASFDDRRQNQRRRDACRHSLNLLRDNPVDLPKPSYRLQGYYTGQNVREEVSSPEELSREKFRRRLEEFNPVEYYQSPAKKQKVVIEKENNLRAQNERNQDLFEKMKNIFGGRKDQPCGGAIKVEKRPVVGEHKCSESVGKDKQVDTASDSETKEESEPSQLSDDDDTKEAPVPVANGSKRETSITTMALLEEIAELEQRIRDQTLSRQSQADQLFSKRFADRELDTLLSEVLLDDIYDIAEDVFDEEEEKARNKELPPDLLEIVEDALHEGPMEEVLIQKYNVDITRRHLQCLLPATWLNDEVINFYFQMMSDRDAALVEAGVLSKRSHFFNSFFYTKVSENGYNFVNVRRWTRKIDLFAMDKIFMPVNVGNMHWCMAVIYMTEKRIQYYDSMMGSGAACLKVLLRYLHDESEHKKKQKFNDEGWELVGTTPDTPQQTNGSDCGVFSCMFADYLSQNRPLTFKQKDIPFHRHRMVLHVTRGYIPLEEEDL
ncbi:hypothetical protein DVH05_017500 [Phytophthora capsici]|nr:hypothetical protein DVH05_017500 [Phytophthora capsici]